MVSEPLVKSGRLIRTSTNQWEKRLPIDEITKEAKPTLVSISFSNCNKAEEVLTSDCVVCVCVCGKGKGLDWRARLALAQFISQQTVTSEVSRCLSRVKCLVADKLEDAQFVAKTLKLGR